MHPYLEKPWQRKNKTRLLATFSLSLFFGCGFSYLLHSVLFLDLWAAAICGAFLVILIFIIANFCSYFKASRVQALNDTIEKVATDFVREMDFFVKTEQRNS